jgi:CheY-like chemotaxis protein
LADGRRGSTLTRDIMRREILVVEDDSDLRDAILDVLESAGFDAFMARNGQEALEALQDRREPALILLDSKMPVMDGFELRRRLLESPGFSAIPVVLLSGDSKDQKQAGNLGFARSLKKPFGEEDLLRIVSQYCGDN